MGAITAAYILGFLDSGGVGRSAYVGGRAENNSLSHSVKKGRIERKGGEGRKARAKEKQSTTLPKSVGSTSQEGKTVSIHQIGNWVKRNKGVMVIKKLEGTISSEKTISFLLGSWVGLKGGVVGGYGWIPIG